MMNKYLVSVIGLGYVGLPLSCLLAETHYVIGFDADEQKIESLLNSCLYIDEPGLKDYFNSAMKSGKLILTHKPHDLRKSCIKIVTVGTPYNSELNSIDMSQLKSALDIVVPELKKGDVLLLKSTVPPGTTSGFVKRVIENHGFKVPEEIGIAFAPERMIEGQAIIDFKTLPKIIGATDNRTYSLISDLLGSIGGKVIKVSNPETAEMAKMVDNYARYVFLALTNELALASEKVGVDILELIRAAKDSYPRNSGLLIPGPGVGGSCLNKDPFILASELKKNNFDMKMVKCSQEINNYMPVHVANLVKKYAGTRKSVVILGVSFKENTDDTRFTPCFPIEQLLKEARFEVKLSDPFVKAENIVPDLYQASKNSEIIVILTKHDIYNNIDLKQLRKLMKKDSLIIDTRGLIERNDAESMSFEYHGVGRQ